MMWSFSASKTFLKCQRQWYFRYCLASARSRDSLRREAYLLSQLQSLSAWRGQLVDHVISSYIIPGLNRGVDVSVEQALDYARSIFDGQLASALAHTIRNGFTSRSEAGRNFAAFRAIEYGESVGRDEIATAWAEIEKAIRNFFQIDELQAILGTATHRISQRALSFQLDGVNLRAVPDLVLFFDDVAPKIVDWKVSIWSSRDCRLQLGLYGLAVTRTKPHRDFPHSSAHKAPSEIPLFEIQLLSGEVRQHGLTDEEIYALEAYVAETAAHIETVAAASPFRDPQAEDFEAARFPSACESCNFRKICWESSHVHVGNQSLFD